MTTEKDKTDFYKVYAKAHNNAVELLSEARILFEKGKHARAYFLAFTGLEEISKSQLAADVYTRFIPEEKFWKHFRDHKDKIDRMQWAHDDANSYPYDQIWLGPDIDDVESIAPAEPLWKKRQKSLYVEIADDQITAPKEEIADSDAREIIHILDTALHRIMEVTEYHGHQIGTKGFMK